MDKIAVALNIALRNFFDFGDNNVKGKTYERKISKINAFLRTLNKKEISVAHKVLKNVFQRLAKA